MSSKNLPKFVSETNLTAYPTEDGRLMFTKKRKDLVGQNSQKYFLVPNIDICSKLCDLHGCDAMHVTKNTSFIVSYECNLFYDLTVPQHHAINFHSLYSNYTVYLPNYKIDLYQIQPVPNWAVLVENYINQSTEPLAIIGRVVRSVPRNLRHKEFYEDISRNYFIQTVWRMLQVL